MLQQDYLFPHMNVAQKLKFALRVGTLSERTGPVRKRLNRVGLSAMQNRNSITLSGAQRARLSLLRTLLSNLYALLLDEPFSRLHLAQRQTIWTFTRSSAAQLPTLLVTHAIDDIPPYAQTLSLENQRTSQLRTLLIEPNHAR